MPLSLESPNLVEEWPKQMTPAELLGIEYALVGPEASYIILKLLSHIAYQDNLLKLKGGANDK